MLPSASPITTTPSRRASTSPHSHSAAAIEASVGPYEWCNSAPGSARRHSAITSTLSASPPQITRRRPPHPCAPPPPTNAPSSDGTKYTLVTPCPRMHSPR